MAVRRGFGEWEGWKGRLGRRPGNAALAAASFELNGLIATGEHNHPGIAFGTEPAASVEGIGIDGVDQHDQRAWGG